MKPSRRFVLTAGTLGLFGGAATLGLLLSSDETPEKIAKPLVTFEDVRKNSDPAFRQSYLDQFKHLFDREFISTVDYDTEIMKEKPDAYASIDYIVGDEGKQKQYRVRVFPMSFNHKLVKRESDILSIIIDHEIEGHARLMHYGSPDLGENAFATTDGKYHAAYFDVYELRAFDNQMKNASGRGVSQACFNQCLLQYWRHYNNLLNADRSVSMKDPEVIDRAIHNLFAPAMMQWDFKGHRFITKQGNHYHWLMSGEGNRMHLPEKLCERMRKLRK